MRSSLYLIFSCLLSGSFAQAMLTKSELEPNDNKYFGAAQKETQKNTIKSKKEKDKTKTLKRSNEIKIKWDKQSPFSDYR
jgi:hypothetical protein